MIVTPEEASRIEASDEVVEFIVHPALLPALVAWLNSRDIDLVRIPNPGENDETNTVVASPRKL